MQVLWFVLWPFSMILGIPREAREPVSVGSLLAAGALLLTFVAVVAAIVVRLWR